MPPVVVSRSVAAARERSRGWTQIIEAGSGSETVGLGIELVVGPGVVQENGVCGHFGVRTGEGWGTGEDLGYHDTRPKGLKKIKNRGVVVKKNKPRPT